LAKVSKLAQSRVYFMKILAYIMKVNQNRAQVPFLGWVCEARVANGKRRLEGEDRPGVQWTAERASGSARYLETGVQGLKPAHSAGFIGTTEEPSEPPYFLADSRKADVRAVRPR
jgi:hypothetical protein